MIGEAQAPTASSAVVPAQPALVYVSAPVPAALSTPADASDLICEASLRALLAESSEGLAEGLMT
ncbi:hypothetical protein PC128_g19167 [Phytophthora cactorum]|nr:hypothetical protein PC120_g16166 [Phytophthora cactorum]KAG3169376.1 hypothetical protein PC128_g19167 [Phytophthora cactorum]KAG4048321.1 hypothetical protein PC123_g16358 [Phytophthora cactorum]